MKLYLIACNERGEPKKPVELTEAEYLEIERAMQWPEDRESWERLNRPLPGHEVGLPI